MGYLYGNLIGAIFAWIVSIFQVSFRFDKIDFKKNYSKLIKLAIPMFPISISAWSLTLIDRILINKLSPGGLSDVGLYGFAIKIASLGSVLWGPFQLAWMPFALSTLKKEFAIEQLERVAAWFCFLSYIVIILITYFSPLIIKLFFPMQYQNANVFIAPLIICNFLNIAYYLPYTSLVHMKKLYPVTLAFVSASILNLILNLWFIPIWGIFGAIIANVAGYLTIFGVSLIFSRNKDYPQYFNKDHVWTFLLMVIFLCISNFLKQESYFLRLILATFSCLCMTLVFSVFKIIDLKMLHEISNEIVNGKKLKQS
jgi:O-antigen/teichoic acid export membrane protein